jgi:hypothetical protein
VWQRWFGQARTRRWHPALSPPGGLLANGAGYFLRRCVCARRRNAIHRARCDMALVMPRACPVVLHARGYQGYRRTVFFPGRCSSERNHPRGKPMALKKNSFSGPLVAANVTIHGASPWHCKRPNKKSLSPGLCSSERNHPRDKPVALHCLKSGSHSPMRSQRSVGARREQHRYCVPNGAAPGYSNRGSAMHDVAGHYKVLLERALQPRPPQAPPAGL